MYTYVCYFLLVIFPAIQSENNMISNPIVARTIAFVAEFGLYEMYSEWINVDFWSNKYKLWLIVCTGEILSTLGVVIQLEFLLFLKM